MRMRRIFAFLATVLFGFTALTAQVTTNPAIVYDDYTGALVLTFDPAEGNAGMVQALECYSHIGLITENSADHNDWKYIKNDGEWGQPTEPKWTRVGSIWQLEIDNFREWFGCPDYEHITGIAMVFHNGKGDGNPDFLVGKAYEGKDIIIPVKPVITEAPTCHYYIEMWDDFGDSWNGNQIRVKEGVYEEEFTVPFGTYYVRFQGHMFKKIPSYGGTPTFTHVKGNYISEVGFAIYAANGEEIVRHNPGLDEISELPYEMTVSPCKSGDIATAVTGLKATVVSDQVDLEWDDNTNVAYWYVYIFTPNGTLINSTQILQSAAHEYSYSGLAALKQSGDFIVVVTPYNASDAVLPVGATTTFDYTAPGVGNVDLSVLIASDSKFNVSNGVKAIWRENDDAEWKEIADLTEDPGTRWWKGTVDIPAASFQIGVKTPEIDGLTQFAENTTDRNENTAICMEVQGMSYSDETEQWFRLPTNDCTPVDHNYVPTNGYSTPTSGKVELDLGVADYAPRYEVILYSDDEVVYSGGVYSWPNTFKFENAEPINVTSWTVQAQDEYWYNIGDLQTFDGFTIPVNENIPSGLDVVVNDDRTCTFTWNKQGSDVDHYNIEVNDEGGQNWFFTSDLSASSLPEFEGKLSFTSTYSIKKNGEMKFSIWAYDASSNYLGYAELPFTMDKPLGDHVVRVMVPEDNNMDISAGVFVWFWSETTPEGKCVEAIKDLSYPQWYEAGFPDDATSFGFLVVNKNITAPDDWTGAQKTFDVTDVVENHTCYELRYKAEGDVWSLKRESDCWASNHNYEVTAVSLDDTNDGYIHFTSLTTVDAAPNYALYTRVHDSGDPFRRVYVGWLPFDWYAQVAVDTEFDYQMVPVDYATPFDQLAKQFEGSFVVKKNPYVTTGLTAEVGTDGVTTTFKWDENINVDHYSVRVQDIATGDELAYVSGIKEQTFTKPILFTGTCVWSLTLFDEFGNQKGEIWGDEFETVEPDYTPQNVQLEIHDQWTVAVSWDLPVAVPYCEMQLANGDGTYLSESLTSKTGHYSFIYNFAEDEIGTFYWILNPQDEVYAPLLDEPVQTAPFSIPVAKFTLQITAGTGGTVNESVNGEYYAGQIVHIAASADMDFQFDQWSDGNTDAERDILINNDITLEAQFSATSHTLTIAAGLGGSVNDDVNGPHPVGEIVHIIATPDEGCQFVEWSDGDTNAERDITMDADINLTASFAIIQYQLTISATTGGSVNEAVNGKYNIGAKVDIEATPESDYDFIQWSDGDKNATREITMDADKTLQAIFAEKGAKFTLTLATSEGGSVNTEVNGEYESGAEVHIVATPAEGYLFDQWSDGDKNAERDIIMISDLTLTASFKLAPKMYTLTIAAGEGGIVNAEVNGSYEEGTDVEIIATPGADYYFNFWSDGDGSATRTITMDEDKSLIAIFAPNVYKYTLTVTASEGGEVNDVSGVYDALDAVNLVATEHTGYTFLKWSDGFISPNRTIYMDANITLEAIFVPNTTKFTLTISAGEHGTVNDVVNGEYAAGTGVAIEATPESGYKLLEWSDGNKDATRTIFLTQDTTLVATFVDVTLQYTLTVSAGANGTVDESVNGLHDAGEDVLIVATPNSGYSFDHWSDGNTDASRIVRMNEDITLEASFKVTPTMYFLTIAAAANGSVNSEVIGAYEEGESVHIVATPDAGYVFDQWSDGDTNAERDIVMDEAKALIATFKLAPVQFTLTISAGANGSVNDAVNGNYDDGSSVNIIATPAEGYEFDKWSDGNAEANRTIVITSDTTLEASFKEKAPATHYTLTISAGEHGSVNEAVNGKYDAGSSVNIIATADEGYVFDKWSDGNTEANRTIVISSDTTLAASFKEKAVGVQYTLTISAGEHGSVNEAVNGKYDEGTNVTIIATADAGYHFDKWSDGNTNATRIVTMNADITLKAEFLSDTKYTVKFTVVKADDDAEDLFGRIKVNDGDEKKKYEAEVYGGTKLTVEAVPEEGYTLNEWSDDEDETALVREFEVTKNIDIKVSFRELKKFTLTVNITPAKSGTVEINGAVREENKLKITEGKSATVKAIPAEGYKFKGWEDANGEIFETAAEASIKMNKSKEITAVFEAAQGFENIEVENAPAQKMIINGQLFILRDGKIFNASGVLVK